MKEVLIMTTKNLDNELTRHNTNLNNLVKSLKISPEMQKIINTIQNFYTQNYQASADIATRKKILNNYESTINLATQVKLGQRTAEDALDLIEQAKKSIESDTMWVNFYAACKLLFWSLVMASLTASITTFVFPLLCSTTVLGPLNLVGVIFLLYLASAKALDCIAQLFESSDAAVAEKNAEKNLISFFANPPTDSIYPKIEPTQPNDFSSSGNYPGLESVYAS